MLLITLLRNLQLGIFSLIFSVAGLLFYSLSDIQEQGFFTGYTPAVGFLLFLQSGGGLLVAATIKYADNILKGFATSLAVILSSVMSWCVLEDKLQAPHFIQGAVLVVSASILYGVHCDISTSKHNPNTSNTTEVVVNNE